MYTQDFVCVFAQFIFNSRFHLCGGIYGVYSCGNVVHHVFMVGFNFENGTFLVPMSYSIWFSLSTRLFLFPNVIIYVLFRLRDSVVQLMLTFVGAV